MGMPDLSLIPPLSDWLDDAFGFRADPLGRTLWRDLVARLLDGGPVSIGALAAAHDCSADDVRARLDAWPCTQRDRDAVTGSIVTLEPTRHRITSGLPPVYTWCAFDAFMLAQLDLGVTRLETTCMRSSDLLTIPLDDEGDDRHRVSLLRRPVPGADLRSAFCCRTNAVRAELVPHDDADVVWLTPAQTAGVARGVVAALGLTAHTPHLAAL